MIIPHPDVTVLMHAFSFVFFTFLYLFVFNFFFLHCLFINICCFLTRCQAGAHGHGEAGRKWRLTHANMSCPAGQHARTHMRTHRPRGHTCNVTFHSRCNYSPNSGPRNVYFFSPRSVSLLVLFFCFFLSKCWWFVHEFLSWGDWVTHLLKSLKAFNILREHAEFFPLRFYH